MSLISKIIIKNFKSFRDKKTFDLGEATYFIGVNNAGKSTVLNALQAFFDEGILSKGDFINKTSFLSKKRDSNVCEITVFFNIKELTTKKYKLELIKKHGSILSISKIFTVSTDTKVVTRSYKINGKSIKGSLPDEITKLMGSIKVTYLHPQEGQELLKKAQEKLRQRLLANWGRGSNITNSIKKLQDEWDELRDKSNVYLSGSLTESLQKMWPNSEITISLPKNIREIITISDINFSGYKNAPEIELTSQGTGAQSTILYLAHFLLDSDRTLHRGEYHPLWLLEEPESFLHVDLLAGLAKQLNSEKWLTNIQMVVSTHSPVLLAGSRVAEEKVTWCVLSDVCEGFNKTTNRFTEDEIKTIGNIMGDPNFFAYFLAAKDESLIFIEDSKALTLQKYADAGVSVTKGLEGVPEIIKFLGVFLSAPFVVSNKVFFIIDADKGKSQFARFYDENNVEATINGFTMFRVKSSEKIFLIFLPEGLACEGLFEEFNNHLDDCIDKLWNDKWEPKDPPISLAGVAAKIRIKKINNRAEAIELIKNEGDVKDNFWKKVEDFDYNINNTHVESLKALMAN